MTMVKKGNMLELTKREQDVFACMREKAIETEGRLRVSFSPAEIRDVLKKESAYSNLKDYDVFASQKNLVRVGLISPIRDKKSSEPINGKKKKLSYELDVKLYAKSEIVTIEKRIGGHPVGAKLPSKGNPVDNAKSIIKAAEQMCDDEKIELEIILKKIKHYNAISKRLEGEAEKSRKRIKTISDLLLLKGRNFKAWEKKLKEKPMEVSE